MGSMIVMGCLNRVLRANPSQIITIHLNPSQSISIHLAIHHLAIHHLAIHHLAIHHLAIHHLAIHRAIHRTIHRTIHRNPSQSIVVAGSPFERAAATVRTRRIERGCVDALRCRPRGWRSGTLTASEKLRRRQGLRRGEQSVSESAGCWAPDSIALGAYVGHGRR